MSEQPSHTMPHARVTTTLSARRKSFLYRVFVENLGVKLISLSLSLALFFMVREDKGKEADVEVPVVLSQIADNQVFVGEIPKTLRVRVRDRWSRLARALEKKASPYQLDLRGFSDGSVYVFEREKIANLIGLGKGSIQSVFPSEMVVKLEPKLERNVPVKVTFVGSEKEGFEVPRELVKVVPKEIKVSGARSSVKEVFEIATYPIDLATLEKDAMFDLNLQKPAIQFLTLEDEKVRVEITVRMKMGEKQVGDVRVDVRGCPEDMRCTVEPSIVTVRLEGPIPVLNSLKKPDILRMVYVDASEFDSAVQVHDGIKPTCDRPQNVKCIIKPTMVVLKFTYLEEREMRGGHKPR